MIQFSLTKKLFKVFTKEEKIIFFSIILIQFISVFLELLSIGSLLPIFKVLTDPGWNEKYFYFINEEYRVLVIFLAVVTLFFIKNLVLIIVAYLSGTFRNKVSLRIVKDTYDSYLNKNYQFHINNHSSVLVRNMDYMNSIDSIFMRLVSFYSDLILAIMSFSLVLFIDVRLTFIALTIIIFIFLTYGLFTRVSIEKYGSETQNYHSSYMKNMMEGIKSFKEILLFGKQSFFSSRNKDYKEKSLKYSLKFTIIELIPKHILELVFVISILSGTYYFVVIEKIDLYDYLPFIGVIVVGLLKFLPNLLRIFSSYQQFKYLLPIIDIINKNLIKINDKSEKAYDLNEDYSEAIKFSDKIDFKNVSFSYENKKILNQVNFVIKKNSTIGISGESGSGKSTLLNIITGLLKPSEGNISIDGKEQKLSNRSWQNKIGYVSQNTHLIDDTIKTNIAFADDYLKIDEELLNECIVKSGLENFIKSLPNGTETLVGENGTKISGGQMQRIGIARAFYKKPEILILDEPTNSLDQENERKIIETLKNLKNQVTMILVSHNQYPLQITDQKLFIKDGKIFS